MLLYLYTMADVHNKEIRSKNMAAIKAKNTKPEMRCESSNMHTATGTGYTIKNSPANLISFCQNIIP